MKSGITRTKSVLVAIKEILPNGLTDLELTHTGALPITLTARMAFDHIEGKAKTDKIATDPYCGCVDTMLGMAYLPNGNGPLKFFKAIVTAQFEANALDDEGTISDGQLIIFSKRAFSQCGHEAIYIASASTKWNEEDNEYKVKHPAKYKATRWERFCKFYTIQLKALHDNTVTTPDHQANQTAELIDRINELEIGNEQAQSNIDRLHNNMQILEDTRSIPGAISTSRSTKDTVVGITQQDVTSAIG